MNTDDFREALSYWASGVTLVASRQGRRVVATTVSSFASLSLDPPLVLLALGTNATILPFLQPGSSFGISILAARQRRLATVHADPFPVGPDPFPTEGVPLVTDALAGLACTVHEARPGGDHTIIIAGVGEMRLGPGEQPLIRYRRRYHALHS